MWDAVCRDDPAYDGQFFYAVETTGIFCRPSCKSKPPKRQNVRFFQTAEQALRAGFRPCKRCRSDLPCYRPMADLARVAREQLDRTREDPERLLPSLGLTRRRLSDIFQAEYGMTLKTYTDAGRLETAKRLLDETEDRVSDIAYASGFSSLSTFNRTFKRRTGLTPSGYRNRIKEALP